jgi:hypothetical protein
LLLREWPNQYFCPLCYHNLETTEHLLIECTSRIIWDKIGSAYGLPRLRPHSLFLGRVLSEWFRELAGSSNSAKARGVRSLIILVCWTIWRERNVRIFEGQEKGEDRLISEVKEEARQWAQAGAKGLSILVDHTFSE